jgi:hypothetical protein
MSGDLLYRLDLADNRQCPSFFGRGVKGSDYQRYHEQRDIDYAAA